MADFVQTTDTKTAVRELTAPIADVTTFSTIVQGVITDNPFGCTAYTYGDVPQDPVMKSRETYTARIVYEDDDAVTVGQITARSKTVAGFNANITEILANAALTAAMGGDPARDTEAESYSCSSACPDPSGEVYYVTVSRVPGSGSRPTRTTPSVQPSRHGPTPGPPLRGDCHPPRPGTGRDLSGKMKY